jgi:hypothetical protein
MRSRSKWLLLFFFFLQKIASEAKKARRRKGSRKSKSDHVAAWLMLTNVCIKGILHTQGEREKHTNLFSLPLFHLFFFWREMSLFSSLAATAAANNVRGRAVLKNTLLKSLTKMKCQ